MLMPLYFWGFFFKHVQMEASNLNETESVTEDGWLAKIKSEVRLQITPLNHAYSPRKKQESYLEDQNG